MLNSLLVDIMFVFRYWWLYFIYIAFISDNGLCALNAQIVEMYKRTMFFHYLFIDYIKTSVAKTNYI